MVNINLFSLFFYTLVQEKHYRKEGEPHVAKRKKKMNQESALINWLMLMDWPVNAHVGLRTRQTLVIRRSVLLAIVPLDVHSWATVVHSATSNSKTTTATTWLRRKVHGRLYCKLVMYQWPRMFIPPGIPAIPRNSTIIRSYWLELSSGFNGMHFRNSAKANVAT